MSTRLKGRAPQTLFLATCVTLAALLQLSALSLLTCGQVSYPHLILQLSESWGTVMGCVQRKSWHRDLQAG